jgi:hypothetical protein
MVKGIAHHADGHNFDSWRNHAAAAAACAAASLLDHWGQAPDVQRQRRDSYISLLVSEVLRRAFKEKPEKVGLEELHQTLPGLLQTFAINARAGTSNRMIQDVMALVRKHR